ncbi:MAG TPA: histidine phosphatase family protein [Humisphaera sp.]
MRKLILVKHAAPVVTPGVPSERWPLSADGKLAARHLAEALRPLAPAAVVASLEPKAAETGEIVAAALGVPFEAAAFLHEHDRSNVPHLPTREFIGMMEVLFRKPTEHVLGRESAAEALARFRPAVEAAAERYPTGNLAVVSHGTVIALLLAQLGGGRGFELWRRMAQPSYAVVDVPAWRVERVVDRA